MSNEYTFHIPETEEDLEQVYKLMREVFEDEGVDGIVRRLLENHPEVQRRHLFTLKNNDETVAHLCMIPQTWRMAGIDLKVAEMGCVATSPSHRRKDIQTILNEKFDSMAKEEEYDICVLAGIPYFYRQYGYDYSIALDFNTTLDVDNIPDTPFTLKIRPFETRDIPKANELLNKIQEKYYVHSVKTKEIWETQHETGTYGGESYDGFTFLEGDQIVAYIRVHEYPKEKTLAVKELALDSPETATQVLAYLKEHCKMNNLEKISSSLSHQDVFTELMVSLGGIKNKPYAWQIKIVDLLKLFKKLIPLFEKRIGSSKFKGHTETLNFNFRKYMIQVKVEKGKVEEVTKILGNEDRTIGLNPYVFPELVLGYKSRKELEFAYPDFRIRPSHKELIDILFPKNPSYIQYTY